MTDENRVTDRLLAPDSNTRRFHRGDAPQWDPFEGADDATDAEQQDLALHRARIHVPRPRPLFGVDEAGTPIEAPRAGVTLDPDTGALVLPETDEDGRIVPPSPREAAEGGRRAEDREEREQRERRERPATPARPRPSGER